MDSRNLDSLLVYLPSLLTLAGVIVVLGIANFLVRREISGELSVSRQLFMLLLTAAGLLVFVFSLPISETSRGQVLSLLGVVATAVIALSSTTFVANVMAGLMLRAVNSFRPGDFIRSEKFFGRVTERGIFHTEIQTEDRDLMTLPNMYLVNNPVTVVHNSGTIISATLSLGYDLAHAKIEELLNKAAEETGLADAYTLVMELNDFSVTYRVGGFSDDINRLLTTKSNLRRNILTILHEQGIEIVSPNFMNQRVLPDTLKMIPTDYESTSRATPGDENSPEDVIFDKADHAAEQEALQEELVSANKRMKTLSNEISALKDGDRSPLERERDRLAARIEEINRLVATDPEGE